MAVICDGGYRSSVPASLLRRHGCRDVYNVLGGMSGWKNAGFETTSPDRPGRSST
ncbi:MAG: rhodanese-like domain-containing protein [Sulfuricaulis sp.]